MANKIVMRGPKRTILRTRRQIFHSVSQIDSVKTIHTSSDPETLVRVVMKLCHVHGAVGGNDQVSWDIVVLRQASTHDAVLIGEIADRQPGIDEIYADQILAKQNSTFTIVKELDIKAMRKLRPGDRLVLRLVGVNADSGQVAGVIDAWFKQG